MLFYMLTHSPRDSKWISSESMWLISMSWDWAKSANRPDSWGCASHSLWGGKVLHLCTSKRCMGLKPARMGEQSIGTLCPWQQTSETVCDAVLSECESPRGKFTPGSVLALKSWTDACQALCWRVWDLESGGVHHLSWGPQIAAGKTAVQPVRWDLIYRSFSKQFA